MMERYLYNALIASPPNGTLVYQIERPAHISDESNGGYFFADLVFRGGIRTNAIIHAPNPRYNIAGTELNRDIFVVVAPENADNVDMKVLIDIEIIRTLNADEIASFSSSLRQYK